MVTFAPEEQQQQVYPYFWSKPTSEPKPDISGEIKGKSLGEGLKTAGEAISQGAHGIAAAYEKGAQNAIYAGVDPLRDEFMEQLHAADQSIQGREVPDPLGRDAPTEVKNLPDSLGTLHSARSGGRISQTDYDARLNALAKEIRAKYPGFRQYVDEEFKRVSGRDSANQYIRSVVQDIDSFITARNAKRDRFETELISHAFNYDGGAAMVEAYQKDPDGKRASAMRWLNDNMAHDHANAQLKMDLETATAGDAYQRRNQEKIWKDKSAEGAPPFWDATRTWFSAQSDSDSGDKKKQQFMMSLKTGDLDDLVNKYTPEQRTQYGAQLEAWGEMKRVQRAKALRDIAPDWITDADIQKQVKDEYELFLKPHLDALKALDAGLAINQKRLADGYLPELMNKALEGHEDLKGAQAALNDARKNDPQRYQKMIASKTWLDYEDRIASAYLQYVAGLGAPPDQPGKTAAQILDDMHKKTIFDGQNYRDIIESIGMVGDKNISPEFREQVFARAFGPDSATILANFTADDTSLSVRQQLGIKGRNWVFQRLTSPDMIKEAEKIGKDKPELYAAYRKWAEASQTYLFNQEVLKISGTSERFARIPIAYNDTDHSFVAGGKDRFFREEINKLSNNIQALASIVQHDPNHKGADPTRAIHEMLLGLNGAPGSVVDRLTKAMEIARNAPQQ